MSTQPYISRTGIPESKLAPSRRVNEEVQVVNGIAAVILAPLAKTYIWASMPTLFPIYSFLMVFGA
jgi:hypothetical protein